MNKLLMMVKFLLATALIVAALFMLSVSIWIYRYGYKPSLILAIPLAILPLMGVRRLYAPKTVAGDNRSLIVQNPDVPSLQSHTEFKPIVSGGSGTPKAVPHTPVSAVASFNIKPTSLKPEPIVEKRASLKEVVDDYRAHYPQNDKAQNSPLRAVSPVLEMARKQAKKADKSRKKLEAQLRRTQNLRQKVENTLSTVRGAASATSAASTVELFDLFSKSKAVSWWSTYENASAQSSVAHAQSTLRELAQDFARFEAKNIDINSDLPDLWVDVSFDFNLDFLSFFNFGSLNAASSDLSSIASQLYETLNELTEHESKLENALSDLDLY